MRQGGEGDLQTVPPLRLLQRERDTLMRRRRLGLSLYIRMREWDGEEGGREGGRGAPLVP